MSWQDDLRSFNSRLQTSRGQAKEAERCKKAAEFHADQLSKNRPLDAQAMSDDADEYLDFMMKNNITFLTDYRRLFKYNPDGTWHWIKMEHPRLKIHQTPNPDNGIWFLREPYYTALVKVMDKKVKDIIPAASVTFSPGYNMRDLRNLNDKFARPHISLNLP